MGALLHYYAMSHLIFLRKTEKREKLVSRSLKPNDTVLTIIIVISISSLIAFGFVYWGISSGLYSQAYIHCKDDVLKEVRTGVYQSVDDIMLALGTCDAVLPG
jgi:hypothetical protein